MPSSRGWAMAAVVRWSCFGEVGKIGRLGGAGLQEDARSECMVLARLMESDRNGTCQHRAN